MIKIQVANSFGPNVIEEPSQVTMAGMETTKHSGCLTLLGSTQQTSSCVICNKFDEKRYSPCATGTLT
jgi:hypothetical protein